MYKIKTMSAITIYNYITTIEKENVNLRNEIDELRQMISYLQSHDAAEDKESVASREDIDSALNHDTDTSSESESVVSREDIESSVNENDIDEESTHLNNDNLSKMLFKRAENESNPFKKNAYTNAGNIIKNLSYNVKSSEDILHIRGIGKNIGKCVDDYIRVIQLV
jgi:hypothetical protein